MGIFISDSNGTLTQYGGLPNTTGTVTKNSTAAVTSGGVYAALQNYSNPNLLINGDFRVNQRGWTTGSTNNKFTVDRWKNGTANQTTTINADGTLTLTGLSSDGTVIQALDPTQENMWGKTYTASIQLSTGDLLQYTFTMPSSFSSAGGIGASDYVNGCRVRIYLNSAVKLAFIIDIKANNTVTLKYCKLEIGSVATTYSPRPYAEELLLCQRYYQVLRVDNAIYCSNASTIYPNVNLIVPLRTNPTITTTTKASVRGEGSIQAATNTYSFSALHENILLLSLNTSDLTMTTGSIYTVTNSKITADAEIY